MAAALAALPPVLGMGVGLLLRQAYGRRFTGLFFAVCLLVLPMLLAVVAVLLVPVVGIWDALLEGFLVGAGLAIAAHRAFASRIDVGLMGVSLLTALLVSEGICRSFLPPPPAFATAGGPHLLLAEAVRAGTQAHSWEFRSKEIVCSALYDERYPGILDVSGEADIVTPRSFAPRADATRRVLHIGDSMVFGFGVARDQVFTAGLERLEPGIQHVNAGIPGTAPDAYLSVLRRWLALREFDTVVMHLFEGNDVDSIDDRYPCCDWQPLLDYDHGRPRLRCTEPLAVDLRKAGWTWLRYNSPPPYLVRALMPYSHAAGHVAAAVVNSMAYMPRGGHQPVGIALAHLESIVRSARDELRERNIAFVVVVLPSRERVEDPGRRAYHGPEILDLCRRLGVAALDPFDRLRDQLGRGERVFLPMANDPHFSAAGHAALASWLHEVLRVEGTEWRRWNRSEPAHGRPRRALERPVSVTGWSPTRSL
jgi:hypothetical protein